MEPRFDPATSSPDPGGCLRGCELLRDMILAAWEYNGFAGCYLHGGTTDSGNPSFHSRGRAIDIWIATGHINVGDAIFNWCYDHRNEIGLNEVICNRRIWRADNLSAGIHAYTINAHTDHIHIALNEDGANARLPFFAGHTVNPDTQRSDMFEATDREKIDKMYAAMFDGRNPSMLRDIMGSLNRAWKFDANDPDSAPFLRVRGIEAMLGALRDGLSNTVSRVPGDTLAAFKAAARKLGASVGVG